MIKRALLLSGAILMCAATASAQERRVDDPYEGDGAPAGADPEIDANYPNLAHFGWKTNASLALRKVHDSAILGFEGDMSFGGETRRGAFYGSVRMFGGKTEGGLTVGQFSVGPTLEWPLDIARFGFKPRLGYFWIDRVTSGDAMDALSLGLSAVLSADVYRSDGFAVAVGAEPVIEGLFSFFELFDEQGTTGMYGVNAFLSFRLRAPRAPKASVARASF